MVAVVTYEFREVGARRWPSRELPDAFIQCAVDQQTRAGALDASADPSEGRSRKVAGT